MSNDDILRALGLNDRTITIGLDDEYAQMMIEKKIDNYLKKIDEENKRKKEIDFLKTEHERFKKKKEFLDTFEDSYVYSKVKNKLIGSGFIYQCKYCWGMDVSGQYGKQKKEWKDKD